MEIAELTEEEREQRFANLCAAVEDACVGYPHTTVLAVVGLAAGRAIKMGPRSQRSTLLTEFVATLIEDVQGSSDETSAH